MGGKYYLSALLVLLLASFSFCVPVDLFVSIDNGAEYGDSASATVTVNASADALLCQLSNDDSVYENVSGPLTFPASMDVSWSLTAGDGLKTVYFRCSNNTVNITWAGPETDTIIIDTTSPEADTFAPADGGSTSDTTPTISAHLEDPGADVAGIDDSSIVLEVDGTNVTPTFTPATGIASYTPTTALSVGTVDVRLWFSDNAGNEAFYSWDFMVSTGPTLSNITPADGAITTESRPDISVIVGDPGTGINTSRTVFMFDDADVTDDTTYSASTGLLSYSSSTLSDGNYTVEVTVYDNGGMSASESWEFTVDRTDPSISLPVPDDLESYSVISEISITVSDSGSGLNISTLEMTVDGVDVMDGTDFDEDSGRLVFGYVQGLEGGTHTVDVSVEDNAGNEASYFWSFDIEVTRPVASSKTPAEDSTVSDFTPEISVVLTDSGTSGLDVETIRLYLDGDEVTSDATFDVGSGKLSYTPEDELGEGKHTARVRVSNNADHELDTRWDFWVDASGPSRATSLIVELVGSTSVLRWQPSTSDDLAGYKVYASTTPFDSTSGKTATATLGPEVLTYNHSGATRYYFAVVSYDDAGNEAEPAFGQNCGEYVDGDWNDYDCCWDFNCASGACDLSTNSCEAGSEPEEPEVTSSEASSKINQAEEAILNAAVEGKDVTEAGPLLDQAQSAYNVGNYEQAYELATRALNALAEAPQEELPEGEEEPSESGKEPNPCCPSMLVLLLLFVSALLLRRN